LIVNTLYGYLASKRLFVFYSLLHSSVLSLQCRALLKCIKNKGLLCFYG
jgi:hypothetical protein